MIAESRQVLRAAARRLSKALHRRQLDAAGGGRRWNAIPRDARSSIHGGGATISARAAHYVLNNPHGAKIAQTLPDQLVGYGIKPIAQIEAERRRRNLHRAFAA